ncbi:MAG: lipoprotein-releasing ABC transporter permease subunit [Nitrospinales bacterium]
MSYELFVSLRHLRARRRRKFISLITWISVAGVAVGVMALIVVIAVMSGFGKDLRDKILGTNSHVVITSFDGGGLRDYDNVIREIETVADVTAAAPFILSQVMLNRRDRIAGVVVRGIDPKREASVSDLGRNLVEGDLTVLEKPTAAASGNPATETIWRDGIILGQELARSLGAVKGDAVSMVSPVGRMTPLGLIPRMKIFVVAGIFDSGMYEYDSNLAFISMVSAQKFFAMKNQASGIEIRVKHIDRADETAHTIQEKLGFPYQARDWKRLNKNLFSALKMEKIVMFIILILIILVAAFNIISTLFMVVMEKNKDISILMAMGASRKSIMKIFSMQGLIIGVAGTILGCAGGFIIVPNLNEIVALVENVSGIDIFPRDVYYLNQLPAEIQYMDSFLIIVFSIAICFTASLYPAWRASRQDPVDGLRYE